MAKPAPASGDWAATVTASGNSQDGYTLPQQEIMGFTSLDPDHNVNDFTAVIHWGDGTTSEGSVTEDPGLLNLYNVNGSHTYDKVFINGSIPPTGNVYPTPDWVAVYEHGVEVGAIQADGVAEADDGSIPDDTVQYAPAIVRPTFSTIPITALPRTTPGSPTSPQMFGK
jgi:hypothetical protein